VLSRLTIKDRKIKHRGPRELENVFCPVLRFQRTPLPHNLTMAYKLRSEKSIQSFKDRNIGSGFQRKSVLSGESREPIDGLLVL